MTSVVIFGAGGLAREVVALVHDIHRDCPELMPTCIMVDREGEASLPEKFLAVVAIGDPAMRESIWLRFRDRADWLDLVHPRALVVGKTDVAGCKLAGHGNIICANSILEPAVTMGHNNYINLAVTIGHDVVMGSHNVIHPQAAISGSVTIGNRCLIGCGARIRQGLTIGDGATVGMGAVVVKDVLPGVTVIGCPARPISSRP